MTANTVELKRMLTTQELMQYVGMSRNKAVAFSKDCGACRPISMRKNLHDRIILDAALDKLPLTPPESKKKKGAKTSQ